MNHISLKEAHIIQKVDRVLSEIGFGVSIMEYIGVTPSPDLVAEKNVDNKSYKIAIEIKGDSSHRKALVNGVETLNKVRLRDKYDKLLLIIPNQTSFKSSYQRLKYKNLKFNPAGIEIIDIEGLEKWANNLPTKEEINDVIFYIRQLNRNLIKLISENGNNLRMLEWRDLERVIAEIFEGLGFEVTLTPSSKDGGKDIILECKINAISKTFIVEIKHWRSQQKVGKVAIKEFSRIIINEKREKGLFLSTYGFTNNYFESLTERERKLVHFGDQSKIVELCKKYERVKGGILNPVENFEEILFENTLFI